MRQIRIRSTFPIFSTIFSPYFTVLQLNAGLRKSPKNLNIHSEYGNKELKRTVSRLVSRKSPYLELFWSVFSRIWTEYGEIHSISHSISLYSIKIRENMDQNKSKYGHFSRSAKVLEMTVRTKYI